MVALAPLAFVTLAPAGAAGVKGTAQTAESIWILMDVIN
jgi:hypothetical protein